MSVKQGTTNSVPKTEPLKNKKYEYRAVEYTPLKYTMSPATSIGGGDLVGRFTDMLYQDTDNGILLNYVYYRETSGATWQYTLEFTHNSITNVFTMVDASGQTVNEWDSSVSSEIDLLIPEYDPSKRTPITDYQNYFDTLIDEPIERLEPVTLQEKFDEIPTPPSNFSYTNGVMSYVTNEGTQNVVMQRVGRLSIPSASSSNIWLWIDGIAKANTTYLVDISTAEYGYNDSCKFLITCTYPGGNNQGLSYSVSPICGTLTASDFFPGRRDVTTNYNDMAIRRPFTSMNSVVNVYQIMGSENASSTIQLQVQNYKNMTGNAYELGAYSWKTLADPSRKYIISDWTRGGVTNFPTYLHFNFSALPSGVYEIYVEIMTATNSSGNYSSKLNSAGYQMTINEGTTKLYDVRYLYKEGSDIDNNRFSPTDITMVRSTTSSYYYQMRVYIAQIGGRPYDINGMSATFGNTPTTAINIAAVWPDVNAQPKTLSNPITIGGVSITTVEAALQALADTPASISPTTTYQTINAHTVAFATFPFYSSDVSVISWDQNGTTFYEDTNSYIKGFYDSSNEIGYIEVKGNFYGYDGYWRCYAWGSGGSAPAANVEQGYWYRYSNNTFTLEQPSNFEIDSACIVDSTTFSAICQYHSSYTEPLEDTVKPKTELIYPENYTDLDFASKRVKSINVDGLRGGVFLITVVAPNATIPAGIVSGNIGDAICCFPWVYQQLGENYSSNGNLHRITTGTEQHISVGGTLISVRIDKTYDSSWTLVIDAENNLPGIYIQSMVRIGNDTFWS